MINDALYSLNNLKYQANRGLSTREGYQWYDFDLKNKKLIPIPYSKLDIKQKIVQPLFKKFKEKEILDLGCDKGYFSWVAMKEGASFVMANDTNQKVYNFLQVLIQTMKWKNIKPSNENLFLKNNNKKFDYVLSFAMIHEVKKIKLEKIIEKIREMSKEGSIIEFCEDYQKQFGTDWNYKKFEKILKINFSNFKLFKSYASLGKKGSRYIYDCFC